MNRELPRILVGIDFSPASNHALAEAQLLAREMGAQLDLIHVCPLASVPCAQRILDGIERRARDEGLVIKTHLTAGHAAHALLEWIQRLQPALVVVGSHGSGGAFKEMVGSVTDRLMRCAARPLLVVPVPRTSMPLAAAR
jgi:nucleotide-binding universal stress UspA family protein